MVVGVGVGVVVFITLDTTNRRDIKRGNVSGKWF